MSQHPDLTDLYAAHPEAGDALNAAFSRGILAATHRRPRPDKSELADLPPLIKGLVRGVLLTRLLLLHFGWLNNNGLGGSTAKSAKELERLVRQQYHLLRAKAAKKLVIKGTGETPEKNLALYLEHSADLLWELFNEADKADDARMLLSLVVCYNEGLIADSRTGEVVTSKTVKATPADDTAQ